VVLRLKLLNKMRLYYKILLLSLLAFAGIHSSAQGVRMGLAASPEIAWLSSDKGTIKSDGANLGFKLGLMTDFFFAERYSFATGIYINNTGGKLKYNDSIPFRTSDGDQIVPAGSTVRYQVQYIEVPLAFHLESNQIGYFVYNAQFGLTSQFKVGASADIDALNMDGVGCKNEVNFFNMGYHVGAGVDYYFSKNTALTLGIFYTNGFIDLTSDKNKDYDDSAYLKSFSIRIGVIF